MSRHFSIRRFVLLFKKHVAEEYKSYLMSFAVLTGLLTLLIAGIAYMQSFPLELVAQEFLYIIPLLLAGAIFTCNIFAALGDKKQAIANLTLPATHFEKYLLGWIFSFLIFLVFYTISFYAVLSIVLSIDDWGGQEKQVLDIFSGKILMNVLLSYALVHAVALVGSIYFAKGQFIKTAFLFFVFSVLFVTLNDQVMELVLGRDANVFPFSKVYFMEGQQNWAVSVPKALGVWTEKIVGFILIVLLWMAAYARLTEKQV